MEKNFWRNRKVLITGFEGFLGSHLTKELISFGAKIIGLDIRTQRKDTILTPADYKKITVIKGDVADFKLLRRIFSGQKITDVFHLAAEAIVEECHDSPLKTFSSNIKGTWCVLEASRLSKYIKTVIVASSDKAYGSHKKLPYTEKAPLMAKHPYDVSKSCADLLAYTYAHTFGTPVVITRCGNIYGPGDFNFSRIIPDTMRCVLSGKELKIRSDGKFTRDYVYVDDIVSGYILAAEKLQKLKLHGEAFNFSDENPLSVLAVVKEIYKIAGKKAKYKILNRAQYEIRHQYLDAKKARRILGWKPRYSLGGGLEQTIFWYSDYLCFRKKRF